VTLPRLLVLTDRSQCPTSLLDSVAAAVDAGARAVVLREKDLAEEERNRLAEGLRGLLEPVGGLLIRAGTGAAAVHLAARQPFPAVRPPLVGRSCHDPGELARARAERCDYVTVSPVYPTASKPGYGPALGPAGLASLVADAPAPLVYALGGVQPQHVHDCLAAGAHGVAVMGTVMRRPGLVGSYLTALEEAAA
jgi:thiamine-phosphate pyrophosphorylase